MAELEKAFLELEGGSRIPCLFNPERIAVGRRNNWAADAMPGKGVPRLRYTGAQAGWMKMELVFDTTADGAPVTRYTGKLLGLMDLDKDLPGSNESTNNARPPTVTFHWGDLHSFPAVVSDIAVTFTYFSSTGTPLRAQVQVELRQYEESKAFGPQNPTSGTPRPHRVHRLQPGETLDRVSARYYGDSTRWRMLAVANGIEDPLAIRPGQMLTIPRQEPT
jgi:hypothetical protein